MRGVSEPSADSANRSVGALVSRLLERVMVRTVGVEGDATLPAPPGMSSSSFAVGVLAAGRYRIVRYVASGGMGEVYAAEDLVLRGTVALKVLRPELEGSAQAIERLRREIALARTVTNPHVCRLHDVGEHERRVFLTMEMLEGETLAERIKRSPLSPHEVETFATQLVEGVAALHRAGIIHRDFKSSNVIVVGEGETARAVITDFGLARSVERGEGDAHLTAESSLLGTPAYMAPEQVEARPATQASDIYSFGVVLFEMLTGKLPFEGDTPMAIAIARLRVAPPRPSSLRARVSGRWDAIVASCLARDPVRRPARIEDVLAVTGRSRRWFLAAGAAGMLGGLAAWRARGCGAASTGTLGPLAVLPISGTGPYAEDPWRVAITLDLYDELGTSDIELLSPYVADQFIHLNPTIAELANDDDPLAKLAIRGITNVVRIALTRTADHVELALAGQGAQLDGWEHVVSRPAAQIGVLVSDAAAAITGELGARATRASGDSARITPAIYERYGEALSWCFRELTEQQRADIRAKKLPPRRKPLRDLTTSEPHLARASAKLAEMIVMDAEQQETTKSLEMIAGARSLADAALAGDPQCALAYAARGHAAMLEWKWADADDQTRRAVELAPNHARVGYHRSFLVMMLGRFDESIDELERRKIRSPDGSEANKGWFYYYARRWPDVVRVVEPTLAGWGEQAGREGTMSDLVFSGLMLALAYAEMTRLADANALADRIRATKPDNYALASLVPIYMMTGRVEDAKAIRAQIGDQTALEALAIMDDAVGEIDAALTKLEQVVASHNIHALFLRIERLSPLLRSNPRFQKLLQTVFGDFK